MSKRVVLILVILMSLSLIGIIFVQAYYLNNSFKNKEEQFTYNVKRALIYVSKKVEEEEYNNVITRLDKDMNGKSVVVDTTGFIDIFFKDTNKKTKETLIYKGGILEENYKFSSSLFDIASLDSVNIKRIISESQTKIIKSTMAEGSNDYTAMLRQFGDNSRKTELAYDDFYNEIAYRAPIHRRVTKERIDELLRTKLNEYQIDIDYEFAVYSNSLATKVQSEDFDYNKPFSVPLLDNEKDTNKYRLLVEFPERKKFLMSSIVTMLTLSIVFTLIIILAYYSALHQLIKHRKISEIKTDFINNMTHEFKTPIATINLALDAIKNPKVIDDKEKVIRYLNMIREENKRMHAQVENVLRISKLEKNELNIEKEEVDLNDLLEDAISHVELIVEDRGGKIKTEFKAKQTLIMANETHLTNVLVNVLDNAIKYSPDAPEITVTIENTTRTEVLVKIKDKGSGMTKAAQKLVFEKFYREHTGDIHNVKGHGLGLAYVKRLVDDHDGQITVESERGVGSTFSIKLPLIS